MLAEPISALKSTVAPVLGALVMAKACGIFPTLMTVMLTTSDVLNLSVGPGEVKVVDELPNPYRLPEISPSYSTMFTVGVLPEELELTVSGGCRLNTNTTMVAQ